MLLKATAITGLVVCQLWLNNKVVYHVKFELAPKEIKEASPKREKKQTKRKLVPDDKSKVALPLTGHYYCIRLLCKDAIYTLGLLKIRLITK